MSRLVDLSHAVEDGMITYRGLPAPVVCDFLSREASRPHYSEGTEFHIGRIDMVANTGTYVDSPFHRFADGMDLTELPLESLANLRCLVADCRDRKARAIDDVPFSREELRGAAVLFHTGWSRHWRTDRYFEGHPFLTESLAAELVSCGVRMVGIDSLNIDDTADGRRPVHTRLLGAETPICEHLCGLDGIPERGSRFFAVPVKVRRLGTFPVRAFAVV